MKYTVIWTRPAEQELADLWMSAVDRGAMASAANSLDALLSQDAHARGESRHGDVRIIFAQPIGIEFEVLQQDRVVYVLAVWSFEKGTSAS